MKNVELYLMTESDIPRVAEIEKECFSSPWSEQALRDGLSNGCSTFVVGKADGIIVGYGGFSCIVDEGDVYNIAVRKEYRGQGVGRKILGEMVRLAGEKGVRSLTLEVRETNVPAIRLYTSFGFSNVGSRADYYGKGQNAILMSLKIK